MALAKYCCIFLVLVNNNIGALGRVVESEIENEILTDYENDVGDEFKRNFQGKFISNIMSSLKICFNYFRWKLILHWMITPILQTVATFLKQESKFAYE